MEEKISNLGFAKLDLERSRRTGLGETIFGPGKTPEQFAKIAAELLRKGNGAPVLGTRCSREQAEALAAAGIAEFEFDPVSRVLVCGNVPQPSLGVVCVCTGGTGDIPVAEEAARCAAFFGAEVRREYDVGVAGLHRLLSRVESLRAADVIVAVAGMEGALASVVAGLVSVPVVAVPTSVGYGASFRGVAPLLAMLNSCAEGVSVVNIDNGFGAATVAARFLKNKFCSFPKSDEKNSLA